MTSPRSGKASFGQLHSTLCSYGIFANGHSFVFVERLVFNCRGLSDVFSCPRPNIYHTIRRLIGVFLLVHAFTPLSQLFEFRKCKQIPLFVASSDIDLKICTCTYEYLIRYCRRSNNADHLNVIFAA